jgi:ribonuclease HI
MSTNGPPTHSGYSPEAITPSVSLSSYGVEDMTEEDRKRYKRSASLSPNDLRKPQNYGASAKESKYPVVPPFRLPSERSTDQKNPTDQNVLTDLEDQTESTSTVSLKRKRSLVLDADLLDSSQPKKLGPTEYGRFRGVIGYRRAEEAKQFAEAMENCVLRTRTIHRHIFWTDGSIVFRYCAAGAVAWKQLPSLQWVSEGFPYPFYTQSTEVVEMFAIAHALKRAIHDIRQSLDGDAMERYHFQVTHEVFVFTDSVGALTAVENDAWGRHTSGNCKQAHEIIEYSIKLHNLGAKLGLHLVPGHQGVPGNMEAHRAAYQAAKRAAAKAGIQSKEQARGLYQAQTDAAIAAAEESFLAQAKNAKAMPVPASSVRKVPKRLRSLSTLSPGNDSGPGKLWKTPYENPVPLPGTFVRRDRTPEPDLVPGPTFTPINAGSTSSMGFTPVNASLVLSTGGPVKASSAQGLCPAVDSLFMFAPADVRATMSKVGYSCSLSDIIHTSPPAKKQKMEKTRKTAVLNSSADSKPSLELPAPVGTPGLLSLFLSPEFWFERKDKGLPVFGETSLSDSPSRSTQPVAGTGALATASPSLGPSQRTASPEPMQSSIQSPTDVPQSTNTFHCLPRPPTVNSPKLGEDAIPQHPPSLLSTSASMVTMGKMRSFASPGEPQDGLNLASTPSSCEDKLKDYGGAALPPRPPSVLPTLKSSTPILTTAKMGSFASTDEPKGEAVASMPSSGEAKLRDPKDVTLPPRPSSVFSTLMASTSMLTNAKMRSFASPKEPKDEVTLAPVSSFSDVKLRFCEDTALPPLPQSTHQALKPDQAIVTTAKMKSFASLGEPSFGLILSPVSSFYNDTMVHDEDADDAALPSLSASMFVVPKTSPSIVTTSKMRSFASPEEPRDALTLAPIASLSGTDSGALSSAAERRPSVFSHVPTLSADVAKCQSAESSPDDQNSAPTVASQPSSGSSFTPIDAGTLSTVRTNLSPAQSSDSFTGAYTPSFPHIFIFPSNHHSY